MNMTRISPFVQGLRPRPGVEMGELEWATNHLDFQDSLIHKLSTSEGSKIKLREKEHLVDWYAQP
jgi:hypothetical protein